MTELVIVLVECYVIIIWKVRYWVFLFNIMTYLFQQTLTSN